MTELMSDFVARPGGVMTDEVGAVTGDLTLRTAVGDDGTVQVFVQYVGADEWYRVTDSPTSLPPGATGAALHAQILGGLRGKGGI